ncbi:ImmA/IrrE family metallo-endopeptidase [Pseudarthrobacter scleromae]|uniref:ImmA/IrrE family metallo-endopeptidase n=1 Tax=Pseudarthrobacter scleromae TaxID=158897 RepID=UPI003D050BB3
MFTGTVGSRVRERLATLGMTQVAAATAAGIKEDAFSNSLNDKRQFKLAELALLAEMLNTSVHWIITGERDPYEVKLSARHGWNASTRADEPHDWALAAKVAGDVSLLYSQAAITSHDAPPLPAPVAPVEAARDARGRLEFSGNPEHSSFADDLPSSIEKAFGIDVFVIEGEQRFNAYSAEANGVKFVVAHTTGAWYRANWNIAHELGHIVHGDLAYSDEERQVRADEAWANAFAAELLAPETVLRGFNWDTGTHQELASLLIHLGVSTEVMRIRLNSLGIGVSRSLYEELQRSTMQVCRRELSDSGIDVARARYTRPRFPQRVLDAHWTAVRESRVDGRALAWMLNIPVEDVNPAWDEGHSLNGSALANLL